MGSPTRSTDDDSLYMCVVEITLSSQKCLVYRRFKNEKWQTLTEPNLNGEDTDDL